MNKYYVIALYLRISLEDMDVKRGAREESNSIEGQRSLLRDFVHQKPEFGDSTVIELCDDGYSGTNLERPAIKKLIEMAKKKEIDCILVKDFSRFGRDYLMVSDYVDQIFPFLDIRFISVNDGYDSLEYNGVTSGIDVAFRNMAYAYYSKDISEKIRSGLRVKAQKGDFLSPFAPFGYQKDPTNKNHLVPEPKSAEIVRRIFHLAASGMGTMKIAYQLNLEQVPPPSKIKQEQGLTHKWWNSPYEETFWNYSVVHMILQDERYLGRVVYGKRFRPEVGTTKTMKHKKEHWIIVSDCHEPLVTLEEFQTAQAVLREYGEQRKKAESGHIFTRKLRCGICGRTLYQNRRLESGFFCKIKYKISKYACKDNVIKESELRETVWLAILSYCRILLERQEYVGEKTSQNRRMEIQKQLAAYQASIAGLEEQKAVFYERLADGEFDREYYLLKRDELSAQQDRLQKESGQLEDELLQFLQAERTDTPQAETLQEYLMQGELTREMIETFVKCIYVYPGKSVHIDWNFDE